MTIKTTNRVAKASLTAHKKDIDCRLKEAIRTTWKIRQDIPQARQVDEALIRVQHECKKLNDYCQALRDELDDRLPAQIKNDNG